MTSITAQKINVMLEDYIKIMEEEHEMAVSKFKKVKDKASKFIYAIEVNKNLKNNNLSKEDKNIIKSNLVKFFGENYNIEDILKKAEAFQDEYKVFTHEDLQKKYNEIPIVLYDRSDLADTMRLIKILDYKESTDLNNTYFVDEYSEENLKKLIKVVYE